MKKTDDVTKQIEKYKWLRDITDDAIKQRSSKSEFHGLEQELRDMQLALLDSYNRTKPIKHPRDKGDHREEILRHFLVTHGLIPKRYGVASGSTRVVATTGHISPELDILLHEASETVILKRFANTLDYYPIESTHGMIQVKSRLTKHELISGLENIRDFKSLNPGTLHAKIGGLNSSTGLYRRFGILFAYEYDLDWSSIVAELERFASVNPIELMPNAVFVLYKGRFMFGDDQTFGFLQRNLKDLVSPRVYGQPDSDGSCLLGFYAILIALLKDSTAGMPHLDDYIRLPLTAGHYSYRYSHGALAEVGQCLTHGQFLRARLENGVS